VRFACRREPSRNPGAASQRSAGKADPPAAARAIGDRAGALVSELMSKAQPTAPGDALPLKPGMSDNEVFCMDKTMMAFADEK